MLDEYYGTPDVGVTKEQHQRLLAVKAALEIAKASASSAAGPGGSMGNDLGHVSESIKKVADAIQDSLK